MGAAQRTIHQAQMNAAGTIPGVASIDTVPFVFPKEKSPGGREWDYSNHAESFLLIGEAMGHAMIQLEKN